MRSDVETLAQLLGPIAPARFFAEYYHRKWLHVQGPQSKFGGLLSWDRLNQMLDMAVWSNHTLTLMLDRKRVPPSAYCAATVDRNRNQVLQPDPERVMELLRRGASLVLNDVETLDPGVLRIARILETEIGAKSAANVYCSWRERQAFDSHCDRHDVYAAQVLGRKRWRIYEGRADAPIDHPAFSNVPQAEYDRMKGLVAAEIEMAPGDLLYLPRGQFHDALAASEASIHITYSCSEPKGLDWLSRMWTRAVQESLFREDLPRPDGAGGEAALARQVERLADRLKELALDPQGLEQAKTLRRGFGMQRPPYALPGFERPRAFHLRDGESRVVRRGADWILAAGDRKRPLAAPDVEIVGWMTGRRRFDFDELQAAFPAAEKRSLEQLIETLIREDFLTGP